MSKSILYGLSLLMFCAVVLTPINLVAQGSTNQIDGPKLKEMIVNIGYETRDLNSEKGKEKYEFTLKKGGLNIPVGAEISPSKNYIWLTVFLGDSKELSDLPGRSVNLLKQNFKVQPSLFYITEKGNLMIAMAIDNRSVDPPVLRRCLEKVTDDVVSSQALWSK